MSIKLNTGVHFRNKNGTWDDSYITEQVVLNDDYKALQNKPILYLTEDSINLSELDEGIYEIDHNGTDVTLSNNSQTSISIPDKSVLFIAKVYQDTKAQLFINGSFYEINQIADLSQLDKYRLATIAEAVDTYTGDNVNINIDNENTISAITATDDDILDVLYEAEYISPVVSYFKENDIPVEYIVTFADGTIMTY